MAGRFGAQTSVWLDAADASPFFNEAGVEVAVETAETTTFQPGASPAWKAFIEGNWPEHDKRPPATPKWLHFTHMMCMIGLGITGMYIRFPFFAEGRTFMRWVHYIAMTIVIINLIARLWYAFASQKRDYREFAITTRDITTAPQVVL